MSTQAKLHCWESRAYCYGGLILSAATELTSAAGQAEAAAA